MEDIRGLREARVKERIAAVQRVFWSLCAAGVLVVTLGLPLGDDAKLMAVLDELRAFGAGFDQSTLEASLLDDARAQGKLALTEVAKRVVGEGVPEVEADGPAIEPRAGVDLTTLGQVHALGLPGATVELAAPDPEALAVALSWRLARRSDGGAERWMLRRIELGSGACSDADVVREREVMAARATALAADRASAEAEQAHTQAEELRDARRKWRAPWKAQVKATEALAEARALMDARAAERDAAHAQYEALAKAGEEFRAGPPDPASSNGVVVATLGRASPGEDVTLTLPTPLVRRPASVGQLRGADFSVARESRFWEELASGSVADGIAFIQRRFSWHYSHVEYGGEKFGGTTVLQLAPALFVVLLGFLLRRTRGVGRSYNPFDLPQGAELPAIGFGSRALNLIPLLVLPLGGCALCSWSLVQLGELVVVPVLSGVLSLALGAWAFSALGELASLREDVTRTHSRVPDSPHG